MKIKSLKLKNFKRFTDLIIEGLPETAKLVVMIGPNGCGKSSVFDALNCYTYILRNSAYPSDDIVIDPLKLSHMIDYYLKNDNPIPFFPVSVEDIVSMCTTSYSLAFLKGVISRARKVSKVVLADCVNVALHHEQGTKRR